MDYEKSIAYNDNLADRLCNYFRTRNRNSFALPVGNCQLSDNTAKMLRSKFLPAMTESGVETAEVSTIAIKPEISFVNKQVVEGGMRNIHTSDIQFNLSVPILPQVQLLQVVSLQYVEKDSLMMTQ